MKDKQLEGYTPQAMKAILTRLLSFLERRALALEDSHSSEWRKEGRFMSRAAELIACFLNTGNDHNLFEDGQQEQTKQEQTKPEQTNPVPKSPTTEADKANAQEAEDVKKGLWLGKTRGKYAYPFWLTDPKTACPVEGARFLGRCKSVSRDPNDPTLYESDVWARAFYGSGVLEIWLSGDDHHVKGIGNAEEAALEAFEPISDAVKKHVDTVARSAFLWAFQSNPFLKGFLAGVAKVDLGS